MHAPPRHPQGEAVLLQVLANSAALLGARDICALLGVSTAAQAAVLEGCAGRLCLRLTDLKGGFPAAPGSSSRLHVQLASWQLLLCQHGARALMHLTQFYRFGQLRLHQLRPADVKPFSRWLSRFAALAHTLEVTFPQFCKGRDIAEVTCVTECRMLGKALARAAAAGPLLMRSCRLEHCTQAAHLLLFELPADRLQFLHLNFRPDPNGGPACPLDGFDGRRIREALAALTALDTLSLETWSNFKYEQGEPKDMDTMYTYPDSRRIGLSRTAEPACLWPALAALPALRTLHLRCDVQELYEVQCLESYLPASLEELSLTFGHQGGNCVAPTRIRRLRWVDEIAVVYGDSEVAVVYGDRIYDLYVYRYQGAAE